MWSDRQRKVRKFKVVAGTERHNPASIRRLLFDMIVTDFGGSVATAAEKLAVHLKDARKRRYRSKPRGATAESYYKVTRDLQTITFSQLEAIALHYEVPLSLVLLYTRVRSEAEGLALTDTREALRILTSFKEAINCLEKMVLLGRVEASNAEFNYTDHKAFVATIEAYLEKYNEMRTSLV